jgi:FAD/FMN-containing dehydrogenase
MLDLRTKDATGTEITLSDDAIASLRSQVRGKLIGRGDDGYDAARKVYNAMINRHPALILCCTDAADVIAGVNFARAQKLTVAIRGGGHNGGGLGVCDDGLVIDLSPMRGVRVDPESRTARVAGGSVWGDVDHATHAFGLVTPSGIISTTGVGGLTLGGGLGHLSRKLGLSIDNLLEVDVVLADGRLVTANAAKNSDLYWAVRGGGGNFGVVTSFVFQLHPLSMVYGGPMLWPIERAAELLRFWDGIISNAPDDLSGFFAFLNVPPGPPFPTEWHAKTMCAVIWAYTGPLDQADEVFKPIRQFGPPAIDFVGPIPQPALQGMFDAVYPPGHQWYWRADFVKELSEKAIERHVAYGSALPSLQSSMHLYPINGAVHRVGPADTAFSYRDARYAEVIVGVDPNPANNEAIITWCKSYWEALHPYSMGGAYVNFLMDEGQERVQATYQSNYARLVEIKNKYDPTNLFHVNQNIRPHA